MVTAKKTARSNAQPNPLALPVQRGATPLPRDVEALLQRARREAERLSHELQALRRDSDELGKRIASDLETSRQAIGRLARRVKELERMVTHATAPPPPAQVPAWPSKSLFTFLGRPNFPSAQ